jgi:putative transposase
VPRTYDPEFRRRVVELVRAGRPVRVVAAELGLAEATVYRWKAQDLVDHGIKPGTSTSEQGELAGARRRIQELETELALVKQAAARRGAPKSHLPVIAELASQGFSAKRCCRILGVAASGFFMWRRRSPSPRQLRFAWLTELIRAIHADSRGTYGWRRVKRRAGLWPRRDRQPQDDPQGHAGPGSARPARSPKELQAQSQHRHRR